MSALYVGLGGFLGALARYGLYLAVRGIAGGLPLGTLVANALGCFAIGAFGARMGATPEPPPELRLFVVVGFLGAFTTYSAFGFETFEYLREGRAGAAATLAALHLTLGVGAVWLGFRAFS